VLGALEFDDVVCADLSPFEMYCVSEASKSVNSISQNMSILKDELGRSILRVVFESKTGSRVACDFRVSRPSLQSSSNLKITAAEDGTVDPLLLRENSLWTDPGAFIIPGKLSTEQREDGCQSVAVQLLKCVDIAHDQQISMSERLSFNQIIDIRF
jgi:hypothetical protein